MVHEFTLKVYLLKDIPLNQSLEKISELIDSTLSRNDQFLKYHNTNQYKYYCFNGFFQLEKNGIYKQGKIYSVRIRTVSDQLAEFLLKNIVNAYTSWIKSLTITHKTIPKRHIQKIYSITPCLIKTKNGYWRDSLSIDQFENQLFINLVKKYNYYYNTKLDEDFQFYHRIQFDNRKPIASKYKNISLLGDKITLTIAENERAQKLTYLALGSGVLESNSRGYGFVNYQYL